MKTIGTFKLKPNAAQREFIAKMFAGYNFVYNYYLDLKSTTYQSTKKNLDYNTCHKDLTTLKTQEVWLKELDSYSLGYAIRELDVDFKKFFMTKSNYPKHKDDSIMFYRTYNCNNIIRVQKNKIKLPKVGLIKIATDVVVNDKIGVVKIYKNPANEYYVQIYAVD